jgi:hypothetical protein
MTRCSRSLVLFYGPEEGGSAFLLNVSKFLPDYTVSSQKIILFIGSAAKTSSHILGLHLAQDRGELQDPAALFPKVA